MARKRDYKAEYKRRIERGLKGGLSRSQARGHPSILEVGVSGSSTPEHKEQLGEALKELRRGSTQKAAARSAGVSVERFRKFIYSNKLAERDGQYWTMTDERPRRVPIIHRGETKSVTVPSFAEAKKSGEYFEAVGQFLRTNFITHLEPFDGDGLTNVQGKFFQFETDPNALYWHDAQDNPDFHEIYQIVN
ncbi:hypothetical protein A9Q96_12190 [Rhodobacterales bacterium 52_120_T64]|nr:hypothetical protein A9Q96_12190 [Rhodobacterales bacterium 52_120_T64]